MQKIGRKQIDVDTTIVVLIARLVASACNNQICS